MHGLSPADGSRAGRVAREVDWSKTSEDYALHRPGYPASSYERLRALGVGVETQRVLDLGAGTGTLAREFAKNGCQVTGVDIAEGQIAKARELAARDGLNVDFRVAPAEQTGLPDNSFDIISAGQCWLYFDNKRVIPEILRLLAPAGKLLTCHLCWLPRLDEIARRSEELVLRHNPEWSGSDWDGGVPAMPAWAGERFRLAGMFFYDEPILFTRVSWRGRFRACRGIGATLSAGQVADFDTEHERLLDETVPEVFTVLHRVDAHILEPLG
ncbi:MAG: class I SAM-dependent methyltransferase [Candidatus Zixiibacteriota bacterium]